MTRIPSARAIAFLAISLCAVVISIRACVPEIRARFKENESLENAKTLGLCCKQYAIDHGGNYPPSLDVLVPHYLPAHFYLASPLKPDEPEGYSYVRGLKDTSPSTLTLIEDKFAPSLYEVRIVVFTDDSGKVLPR